MKGEDNMRNRVLSLLMALCLLTGLFPMAAQAAPRADGDGLTAENPMDVPAEHMVIKNGTYYGISFEWFKEINPEKQPMYFSITLPNTVTTVFDDGFRDSWSSGKENNGAATYYNGSQSTDWARYNVVSIDFSEATSLTKINKQAAMYNTCLSGTLDLSKTKIKTIEKSAFSGCTGLTGVVLPNTLEVLGAADGSSGSVFNGCTNLKFVRAANENDAPPREVTKTILSSSLQAFK